jgi:plastin-3
MSFSAYRNPNSRSNSVSEDGAKDVKSNIRESRLIQPEQWQLPEIQQIFEKGAIDFSEIHGILQQLGIKIQRFELTKILDKHDRHKDGQLTKDEFEELYVQIRAEKDPGSTWNKTVKPTAGGVDRYTNKKKDSTDDADPNIEKQENASGPYHSVLVEERVWTANWLNQLLADDAHLNFRTNPIDSGDPQALYKRCQDGILLCKLINLAVPKTIDERAMNLNYSKQDIFRQSENLELAINSARGIGCKVVNIHPENISKAVPHLVMGLLWQIIRIQLTSEINLKHVPGLVLLLRDGETAEDLLKLSPEELLLRWFNYQLQRSQYKGKPVSNFSGDIKDSEAYTHLLHTIAPGDAKPPLTLDPLKETDLSRRAELMLQESDKIKARAHISPADVVKGNPKLNFAFVANLFNTYPALDPPTTEQVIEAGAVIEPGVVIEETREEKTYRNFINSFGFDPHVNYLYSDLCDGLIILQLYDIIRPNTVDWSKIYKTFKAIKERFQKLNNCNFVVDYAKDPLHLNITGIAGSNILEGNKTLTLGLVWQVMRAYTLSILQKLANSSKPIADKDIINWANEKLKNANKTTFLTNFQDQSLSDSLLICDLIDAIKPGSIKYDLLKTTGTAEAKMDNALYAISMARKIGAPIYALPDDIVETKQKMLLTVFACLMANDLLTPKN